MQYSCDTSSVLNQSFHLDAESTMCSSIFEKYKQGSALPNAPFKLFEMMPSFTSAEDDSSNDERNQKIRGPYRKYTCLEKQEAVERIQNGEDVKLVSKEYGIPRRNLLRWKKHGCERKEGGGRPTDEEMEKIIYMKIKKGQLTDEKQVRDLAIRISKVESFKASKGWFAKFCQRFDIKLSSNGNPLPEESTSSICI